MLLRLKLFSIFTFSLAWSIGYAEGEDDFRVVGYVQNDFGIEIVLPAIEGGRLTHVNLSFENPIDLDGTMSYHENNDKIRDATHRAGGKVLVAIGGGAAATDVELSKRYDELLSAEKRVAFARSLVEYVNEHELDGIDVDIEGPAITDDYGPFVKALSAELKKAGKTISAALSHGYGGDRVTSDTLAKFDFINVMAYNATGPWNPNQPGQHSSIELAESTTKYWIDGGLPKSKVVLGVPFYGYGFGKDVNQGIAYREILNAYPQAASSDECGNTIYYNGVKTIRAKTQMAMQKGLGGVMIWAINQDADGDASLLRQIEQAAKEAK